MFWETLLFRRSPRQAVSPSKRPKDFYLLVNPAFRAERQYRNGVLEAPDELFPDGRLLENCPTTSPLTCFYN